VYVGLFSYRQYTDSGIKSKAVIYVFMDIKKKPMIRDPKTEVEVYEAGLLVLEHATAEFVSEMLELGTEDKLNAGIIYYHLKLCTRAQIPEVAGFRLADTVYDEKLLEEWLVFLQALKSHELRLALINVTPL
jgi:hypothetical protein